MHTRWRSLQIFFVKTIPAFALTVGIFVIPLPPAESRGLSRFAIKTNCFDLSEQREMRRREWSRRPVAIFAPGVITAFLGTATKPDQVLINSNNPALIAPYGRVSLPATSHGLRPFNIPVKATGLRKPTNVTVTAQGKRPDDRVFDRGTNLIIKRDVRVYPKFSLRSVKITPRKPVYEINDVIQIHAYPSFEPPWSTAFNVNFFQPTVRVGNSTVKLSPKEWDGKRFVGEMYSNLNSFTLTLRSSIFEEASRLVRNSQISVTVKMVLVDTSEKCSLTTAPNSITKTFKIKNRWDPAGVRKPAQSKGTGVKDTVRGIKRNR